MTIAYDSFQQMQSEYGMSLLAKRTILSPKRTDTQRVLQITLRDLLQRQSMGLILISTFTSIQEINLLPKLRLKPPLGVLTLTFQEIVQGF